MESWVRVRMYHLGAVCPVRAPMATTLQEVCVRMDHNDMIVPLEDPLQLPTSTCTQRNLVGFTPRQLDAIKAADILAK